MQDQQSIDEQLRVAIAHKRLIELRYHDRLRVAEPHDYGIKNGRPRLLAYQLRASSKGDRKKPATGWRLLDVEKIAACTVLNDRFPGSRGQDSQSRMTWGRLFARVS